MQAPRVWLGVVVAMLIVVASGAAPVAAEVTAAPDATLPRDAAGWTIVAPAPDTRSVYVSSSAGDDDRDGLEPDRAVKTLAKGVALLRDGFPDRLLLCRGDTWLEPLVLSKSGRSAEQRIVVSSYGDAALPRPTLRRTAGTRGRVATKANNIAVIGLILAGDGTDAAVGVQAGRHHVLFEDIDIRRWKMGVRINGEEADPCHHVTVRRCVIADNTHLGMYIPYTDDLLIEENVFDHNGTRDNVRHHNIYKSRGGNRHIYRGNILSRGANYGLKTRARSADYTVTDNLFVHNQNGLSIRLDGDDVRHGHLDWHTSDFEIGNNVFLETGRGIGAFAIDAANVDGLNIHDNHFVNANVQPYVAAIWTFPKHDTAKVQRRNVTVARNVIAGFTSNGIRWSESEQADGTGPGNQIRDNIIQLPASAEKDLYCQRGFAMTDIANKMAFANNTYYVDRPPAQGWFRSGGAALSLAQWIELSGETGATLAKVTFRDPQRTTATYNATLGGEASFQAFIAAALKQSRSNWRPAYTAAAVNRYIRQGFEIVGKQPIDAP